jgi:hypothetical protein
LGVLGLKTAYSVAKSVVQQLSVESRGPAIEGKRNSLGCRRHPSTPRKHVLPAIASTRANVLHVHYCMRHTEYDSRGGARGDAGESDFMCCIHWPSNRQHLFPGGGVKALSSFTVSEWPPPLRFAARLYRLFPHLANAGATACIACRMASETFLQDSPLFAESRVLIILRVDLS